MIDEIRSIDIARQYIPQYCSYCNAQEMRTLETRAAKRATRRRKACLACGKRETTYEISQSQYEQLQAVTKIRAILLGNTPLVSEEPGITCSTCIHWENRKCDMGFPEAGGVFAKDCACYQTELEAQ